MVDFLTLTKPSLFASSLTFSSRFLPNSIKLNCIVAQDKLSPKSTNCVQKGEGSCLLVMVW